MDCKTCKESVSVIPYYAHEADMSRLERTVKRLWIALILVIVLLFGSNLAWTIYENQFEDMTVSQDVDTGEGDAYVAGVGDVNYGESKTNSQG